MWFSLKFFPFQSIGYSIAERLAKEGAKVVISSRKEANVNKAIAQLKDKGLTEVCGVKCHVALAGDRKNLLKTALDHFGGVDILVSNAAVNPTVGSVLDCPEESWDKIFEVNVKSAFLLAKEFTPVISEKANGSIVFVSSYAGMNPFPVSRINLSILYFYRINDCYKYLVAAIGSIFSE